MNTIAFQSVTPRVFSQAQEELRSGVWQHDVVFERGKFYLLEAESGKGKSTFCSYILGYRDDYEGRIAFDDRDARSYTIADWSRLRRQHVSCLFQELRLFPELTALDNVLIKNSLTHTKTIDTITEWFHMLGIADKMDAKVGRMSFGQQQRVALMRALVQPFDFLLADEPISHVDDRNAQLMVELLTAEAQRQGAAVIATSIGKRLPLNYDYTLNL